MFKKARYLVLELILVIFANSVPAAPRAEHVFIISIDGGKPAVIAQSKMPILQKLAAEGAHTWRANTIFPSITLPSHTSMLTGVAPDKHHVLWNSYQPKKGIVAVPTVFSEAKKAGLSTAMFVGKEKFQHLIQPGMVDEFDYNREQSGEITKKMVGDAKPVSEGTVLANVVAADAAAYIVTNKPNLCFIHLTDPDNSGHKYGWGSPQQIDAFEKVDAALGVILKALEDAGIAEQSVIIISADHGGHAKTHGSALPIDMDIPWIAWGRGVKKGYEIAAPVKTFDTAATALWLLDVPRPELWDGIPVTSAFE